MKRNSIYLFICVFVLVFSLSFLSAAAIDDDIHLNIQTTNVTSGEIISGTFEFQFNITTDDACSSVIYSNTTSLTTDSRGIVSYYLEDVALDFDQQYYLCYYRDSVLINASKIARSPYAFRAQNITLSGVDIDANLDMTGYNVTADYFIGDGSLLTNIDVGEIDLSAYVPYTGSAANVVLGAYNLSIDSSKFFFNVNTGRLGIGTATPGYALDVVGSIYASSDVLAGGTAQAVTRMRTPYMTPYTSGGNFDIRNYAGNTSYLSVNTTSGKVGVGTENPTQKLDVLGNINISGYDLYLGKAGTVGGDIIGESLNDFIRYDGDTNDWRINSRKQGDISIGNSKIILNNASVGINTTNPQGTLDVNGTLCLNGDCKASWDEAITGEGGWNDTGTSVELVTSSDNVSANTLFVDNSAGYVGVGTSSPGVALDVSGTISASSNVLATTSVQSPGYFSVPTITPYSSGGNVNITNYARDTAVLTVNTTAERVGIGTTSPSGLLDVNGTLGSVEINTAGNTLDFTRAGLNYIKASNAAGAFIFQTGGSNNRMTIESGGDVGIGTTSPDYALDVAGNVGIDEYLYHNDDNDSINTMLRFEDDKITLYAGGSTIFYAAEEEASPSILDFGNVWDTNFNSNSLFIGGTQGTEDGNVGVGTSSPDGKFHVYSGSAGPVTATADADDLVIENAGNTGLSILTNDSSDGTIMWSAASDTIGAYMKWNHNANLMTIATHNADDEIQFQTGVGSDAMRIDSSGQVGIGTTTPQNTLNVIGDGNFTGNVYSNGQLIASGTLNSTGWNKSGTNVFLATTTDSVGIGTTTPNAGLDIVKGVSPQLIARWDDAGGRASVRLDTDLANAKIALDKSTANNTAQILFETAGVDKWFVGTSDADVAGDGSEFFVGESAGGTTPALWIESGGNVGIGTTSPQNPLNVIGNTNVTGDLYVGGTDIYGDTTSQSLKLSSGSGSILSYGTNNLGIGDNTMTFTVLGTAAMKIMNDGDVGIGTTTPQNTLNVIGDGNFTGNLYSNGALVGDGTLNSTAWNSTGDKVFLANTSASVGIGTTSPSSKLTIENNGTFDITQGLTFGDGDTGFYESTDDTLEFIGANTDGFEMNTDFIRGTQSGRFSIRTAEAPTTTNPVYTFRGDLDTGIGGNTADVLSLIAGGVNGLNVNTTGGVANVGIGTTSPGKLLHINGSSQQLRIEDSADGQQWDLNIDDGRFAIYDATGSTLPLRIEIATPTDTLYLDNNGRVGIGTASPVEALHVHDTDADNDTRIYLTTAKTGSTATDGLILEEDPGNNAYIWNFEDANMYLGTNNGVDGSYIVIRPEGNVGIGTQTPQNTLNVIGDGNFTGNVYSNGQLIASGTLNSTGWNKSGTDVFLATTTDSVGIGVTDPDAKFHVEASSGQLMDVERTSVASLEWHASSGDGDSYVYTRAGGTSAELQYRDDSTLTWTGGNVGIGTTSPTSSLAINSSNNYGGFEVTNSTGSSRFFVNASSGNVGIGTTSPGELLHVSGGNIALEPTQKLIFNEGSGDNTYILEQSNDNLGFVLGGTTRLSLSATDLYGGTFQIRTDSTSGTEPVYSFLSDDTTGMGLAGAGALSLTAGATEMMRLNGTSGNVGIGNTTPVSKLHLGNNGTYDITQGLVFGDGDSGIYEDADDNLVFSATGQNDVELGSAFFGGDESDYSVLRIDASPSATRPGFTFRDDSNTGIGTAAADKLSLIAGGAEVIRTQNVSGTLSTYVNGSLYVDGQLIGSGQLNSTGWNKSGTNVFLATTTDSVGIGITNPSAPLHIKNSAATQFIIEEEDGGSQAQMLFEPIGSTGTLLTSTAGKFYIWDDAGANPLIVADHDEGTVGIGTASPGTEFHVKGSGAIMRLESTSATSDPYVEFYDSSARKGYFGYGGDGDGDSFSISNEENSDMRFFTNSAARMIIDQSGNVGIGTTSPTGLLTLNETPGDHSAAPTLAFGDGDSGFYEDTDDIMRAVVGGTDIFQFNSNFIRGVSGGGSFYIADGVSTSTNPVFTFETDTDTGMGWAGHGVLSFIANGTNVVNINGSNVGIGTASPGAKLDVSGGDIHIDSGQKIYFDGGSNTYVTEESGDDVRFFVGGLRGFRIVNTGGVLTTSINAGDSLSAKFVIEADQVGGDDNDDTWRFEAFDGGNLEIQDFSTGSFVTSMAFANGGNVGINTTTPQNTLNIVGDLNVTGNIYGTGGSTFANGTGTDNYLPKWDDAGTGLEDSSASDSSEAFIVEI